ncbi:MAG: hypothetical protein U9R75_01445, partial [Candidatus Thermoplasmatota archaeon]|nr:hypothetical protein [Candidatus Thermoplasmatota archaeon]
SPVTGLIVSDLEDNENGLMIQWNASFEEDLDHYTIYRWDEGEGPFDTGSASSERETGTNTTFIDRNVTDGKHYWYAVIAHDGLDSDLENFTVVYGSPVDDVAPLRIEGTTAVIINDTDTFNVNLGWRPSNDTRFREYRIYRSPCSLENISLTPYHMIEENRNTTSFTDENVQWNTTYWYTVTAVDVFGNELKNGTLWVNITCNPPVIEVEPETGEKGDGIPIWPIVSIVILVALVLLFIMSLRVFKYPEEE